MRSFLSQPPLATRRSVWHLSELWLATALTDSLLIGWNRYVDCGLRRRWSRWFLTASRETGAGPAVEKWREWSTRTDVERKHRAQNLRDRAGVQLDGVRNTPVPENLPLCTRQVSQSTQRLGLPRLFTRFKCPWVAWHNDRRHTVTK